MKKLFSAPNKRYRNLVLLLLPFIIVVITLGFLIYKEAKATLGGVSGKKNSYLDIEKMDYHLRYNATDLQKELFKQLSKEVNKEPINDVEAAKLVAQCFIADFFTWSNKNGQADIGGMYYVYSPQKINIFNQARDSFYRYLSTYLDKYQASDLLEVDNIEASGSELKESDRYKIEGVSFPTYGISVKWAYKPSNKFKTSEFMQKAYLTVIKNKAGRYEIVQEYGEQ